MKEERIIGNNIQVLLKEKNMDNSVFASSLGYSNDDLTRIREGRAYLSLKELNNVAAFLGISRQELLTPKSDEEYEKAGCIHYNHHFKDQANLEEIMDLFDLICDIEEVL